MILLAQISGFAIDVDLEFDNNTCVFAMVIAQSSDTLQSGAHWKNARAVVSAVERWPRKVNDNRAMVVRRC